MSDVDTKLALRAQRGDAQALSSLYEAYRSRLYGYLVAQFGADAAGDVFQEAWTKVLEKIDSYDPEGGTFRAWLFRIASNAGIDRARREAVRRGPELDAPVTEDGARRIDLVAGDAPGPEREGASRMLGRHLAAALQKLPENQRAAVLLRHQQGYSFREIAVALGMREVSARTAVHRGLKRLREELGEWSDA